MVYFPFFYIILVICVKFHHATRMKACLRPKEILLNLIITIAFLDCEDEEVKNTTNCRTERKFYICMFFPQDTQITICSVSLSSAVIIQSAYYFFTLIRNAADAFTFCKFNSVIGTRKCILKTSDYTTPCIVAKFDGCCVRGTN